MESTLGQVKTEVETLKDQQDRYSRDSPPQVSSRSEAYSLSPPPPSITQPELQDKLKSLAILTSSVRSAVSRIEREVHGMAVNTTVLMQNMNYLQRNLPTKQFINSALLGVKNQAPVYTVMPSPSVGQEIAASGNYIFTNNGYGQWNQSVPTNCKFAPRKFGINKIQLYGGSTIKDPFFVNCIDGWTVS